MSNFHNESDDRREGRSGGPRRDGSGGKFYQKFVPGPDSQQNDNGPAERGNRRDDKPRGERSFGNARRRDDDRPRTGQGNDRDSGNRRFSSDRNNDRREPRSNRDDNRSGERSPRSFDSGRRDDSRPFNRDDNRRSESRPFNRDNDQRTDSRPFNRDDNRGNESRPFNRGNDRRDDSRSFNRDDRGERRPFRDSNANSDQPQRRDNRFGNERSFGERSGNRFDGPRRDGDAPRERRDDSRGFQRSNRDDQRSAGTRGRARREGGYQDNEPRFDPAGPRRKTFGWNDQADENRPVSRPDAEDDNRFNRRDDDRPAGRDRDRSRDSRFERPRRDDRSSGGYRNDRSDRFDRSSDSRRSGTDREDAQARRRIEDSRDRQVGTSRVPNYDVDRMKSKLPRNNKKVKQIEREDAASDGSIRLNRYIANSGICSRRDADALIANGDVSVNGNVVIEMGHKVQPGDTVKYGNRVLNPEKMMYVLLNKPKDYITTTEDPNDRNTVMDLVAGATPFRIYPVGRLDRNTTGLLLLTNDGELVEKLTHPSHNIKKVYQVEIDKPLTDEHFEAIKIGLELEDGFIKPDDLGIVTPDAQVIGIEIHSGRNRIVRRIFEHFGYEVTKLDRTVYAGLNKKDLPRGKWRYLSEKEVIRLKFLL